MRFFKTKEINSLKEQVFLLQSKLDFFEKEQKILKLFGETGPEFLYFYPAASNYIHSIQNEYLVSAHTAHKLDDFLKKSGFVVYKKYKQEEITNDKN